MITFKLPTLAVLFTTMLLTVSMLWSCNSTKSKNKETVDSHFIYSELIVSLKKEVDIDVLFNEFKSYKLAKKKAINARMGLWLLTYDTDKIDPKKMLKKIRAFEGVVNAEFNKNLTGRE